MPFNYKIDLKNIRLGQAVDSFIIEKYRRDPFMLRKLYLQLKILLIIKDIKAVLSVPNEIDQYSDVFEFESWNYGLINFDVR